MLRHIKPGMLVFSVLYILLGLLLLLAPQAVADVFCIALGLLVVLCGLQMLMCHKVTHKKLIDNSPLFRKNFKVEFHGSHTNCVASFA